MNHDKTSGLPIYPVLMACCFFATCCLQAFGEFSKEELKQLEDVEIAGVRTDTWKDDDRNRYEVLEINTFQNKDDPLDFGMDRFRIRLVVVLTDKQKTNYLVQFAGSPNSGYDSGYQGEDYWKLYIPHGDLERLKISAFVVQYGIMDDDVFVPLAEKEDNHADILSGLNERTLEYFPGQIYLRHYYMYDDQAQGSTESVPLNVKAVK